MKPRSSEMPPSQQKQQDVRKKKVGNAAVEPTQSQARGISPRDRVIKDVVSGIYSGKYKPGQRLIEAQLTEGWGISRGPVREALNRLAAMGLVELTPQRGAQIRSLSPQEAINSLIVAQGLVGIAARLAAQRQDDEQGKARLNEITSSLLQFDQTSSSAEYALARDSFYSALNKLADNATLSNLMTQVHMDIIRVQFRSELRKVDRRRHGDYVGIAQAVLEGNAGKAERLARAHLDKSITALKTHSLAASKARSERP